MRCNHPVKINQPDALRGLPYTYVPCGRCAICLSNKRREWLYRLRKEYLGSTNAHFITLTYDDEHLPKDGKVNKKDVQKFLKRLRKSIEPYKIRYFIVSEYGENFGRPHYHLLLFNFPNWLDIRKYLKDSWPMCNPEMWKLNGVIGKVTDASINYCAKYCVNNLNDVPP